MKRFAVAIVAVVGMASHAEAGVEIGGTAGVHLFSESNALGTQIDDPVSHANSALFGFRLGVYFGAMFGVEAEGGVIPTESRGGNAVFDVYDVVARGHLIAQFRAGDPSNSLIPFLIAGGGAMQVNKSNNEQLIRKETDGLVYAGLGAKYRAGGGWGVRFDARVLIPPSNKTGSSVTLDFEGLLSLYREFGRKKAAKVVAPKAEVDSDKDGINDSADKCVNEAEDKDGFEDDDGCPDPDNDGDGIADGDDKCPLEPEDKDTFEDNDGCPDPDNDADGIPDAADKCPDDAETQNGFEDEDGCADEVPEALRAFTGAIKGITFKPNSASLAASSNKTLDKATAVLTEFKDVRLEIQGHTDDQAPGKRSKFADNDALSQARAESVKAYIVGKGIDEARLTAKGYGATAPVTDPAGLKGRALKAARAANRRVEFKLLGAPTAAAPEATEEEPAPPAE